LEGETRERVKVMRRTGDPEYCASIGRTKGLEPCVTDHNDQKQSEVTGGEEEEMSNREELFAKAKG